MRELACPHTRSGPTHVDLLLAIAPMYGEVKEPLCLLTACLGIPVDAIHISETSTNTVANASACNCCFSIQWPIRTEWLSRWVRGDRELFASRTVAILHVASSLKKLSSACSIETLGIHVWLLGTETEQVKVQHAALHCHALELG